MKILWIYRDCGVLAFAKANLKFLIALISLLCYTGLSAQTVESEKLDLRRNMFHGRWHQVEIKIELDSTDNLGSKARETVKRSAKSQAKVKKQIAAGELAVVTQFNHDGTFSHQVIYAGNTYKFSTYRETGTWSFDAQNYILKREALDQEYTTLKKIFGS